MAVRKNGKRVKIGLIQVNHIIEETTEEKQRQLLFFAEECLKSGAELVFFPEAFQYTSCREIINDPQKFDLPQIVQTAQKAPHWQK